MALAVTAAALPSVVEADGPVPPEFTQLYGVNSSDDSLSRVLDLRLGAIQIVGPIGSPAPTGLAIRPGDGRIFVWDSAIARVLVVDRCTGAGTPLMPSGLGSTPTLYDLLFTADGALVGLGDFLADIDQETGVVGTPHSVTFADGTGIPFLAGADYGPDGNLYVLVDNRADFAPTVLGILDLGRRTVTPVA